MTVSCLQNDLKNIIESNQCLKKEKQQLSSRINNNKNCLNKVEKEKANTKGKIIYEI